MNPRVTLLVLLIIHALFFLYAIVVEKSYMIVALDENQHRVLASKADRKQSYFCQECGDRLSLRQGEIRRPHFAHKKSTSCESAHRNKTDWHYDWQELFGLDNAERAIQTAGIKHIADILIGDTVIEFQHSRISEKDICERNEFYRLHNLRTIWVFDCRKDCENGELFAYERRPEFNWLFEWRKPIKSARTALWDSVVFLQLSDNCLIEITWFPSGMNKTTQDYWCSLNKFAANIMDKKHAVAKIKSWIDSSAEPELLVDSDFMREMLDSTLAGQVIHHR